MSRRPRITTKPVDTSKCELVTSFKFREVRTPNKVEDHRPLTAVKRQQRNATRDLRNAMWDEIKRGGW